MEFSELLVREHAPIRRALKVLEGMAQQAELGLSINGHDVNALLIFLHYFADACHQAKEEGILFPLLRQSRGSIRLQDAAREQLESLLGEHHEERALVEKIQIALFSEKPSDFIESAKTLVQILSEHAWKEEEVLFPLAEKILTEEEAEQAVTRIEQANADFGSSQRTLLMELLQKLELKYQRKAA